MTTGATTHVRWEGLGFGVPSSWTFRPANIDEHYIFIVGFVGTAPSFAECVPTSGPGQATGQMCHSDLALEPGTVSVMLQTEVGPGPLEPMGYLQHPDPSSTTLDVDGVPALVTPGVPSGNATAGRSLLIQSPRHVGLWLSLTASIRGPGETGLTNQVDALFASLHFEPATTPLPTDDSTRRRIVERAVPAIAGNDPGFACFPRVPGGAATTTVEHWPFEPERNPPKPHKATCRTTLETTPIGFWKLTLAIEWGAPGDAATTYTVWSWLDRDGTRNSTSGNGQYPP